MNFLDGVYLDVGAAGPSEGGGGGQSAPPPSSMSGDGPGGGGPQPQPQVPSGGTPQEGSAEAITLSDDALIIPPGAEEGADPVRYSDWIGGYVPKDELTRMRQEEAERNRQEVERYRAEIAASYKDAYQRAIAANSAQGRQGPAQPDPRQQQASEINQMLDELDQNNGGLVNTNTVRALVGRFNQALAERDQIIGKAEAALQLVYGNQQKVNPHVNQLLQSAHGAKLESAKAAQYRKYGIPETYHDHIGKVIDYWYNAHEPGSIDLDRDLPQFVDQLMPNIQKMVADMQKADLERGRSISGKGGQASPSLPASNAGKSERALADEAWNAIQVA